MRRHVAIVAGHHGADHQTIAVSLEALEVPGADAAAARGGETDTQALLERIRTLEQRLTEFESTTVLSEPETRVKRIEIWVDKNGNQYDEPVPGAKAQVTYQRERAYRRQTINEKIEAGAAPTRRTRASGSASTPRRVAQFAEPNDRRRGAAERPRLCAGVGRPVLHGQARAAHDVLRRRRRA